jgi:hypothetical protein
MKKTLTFSEKFRIFEFDMWRNIGTKKDARICSYHESLER